MRMTARTLCLLGLALTLGCRDDSPSPTAPDLAPPATSLGTIPGRDATDGLAICQVARSWTAKATIGPAGGTLRIGPHTLVVPPGALDRNVVISAASPIAPFVIVMFKPEGLHFAIPATLTMDYSSCPASLVHPVIVYVSANLEHVQRLPSTANDFTRIVSAPLHHFSSYMVAH